jgi:CRP/FNR family cyclic AMP-dependent transcriptional regulator
VAADTQLFERFGKSIAPGEVIFEEGDEGEQMFIIQNGRVRIVKRFSERNHTLAMLGSGDFFGEMAIVNRVRRTASAIAVAETSLLAVDREGFLAMIKKNAEIGLNIIDKLCLRLQNNHQQMQQLARQNGDALVALHLKYALQNATATSPLLQATIEEISLALELPKEDVAARLEQYVRDGVLATNSAGVLQLADSDHLERIIDGESA